MNIEVNIEQLLKETRDITVIDMRTEEQFLIETYPNAVHVDWFDFDEFEIDSSKPIYLICDTGLKTYSIALEYSKKGYEIYSVEGGMEAFFTAKISKENDEIKEQTKEIERSIIKVYRKNIWRKFTKAINEYQMIQDGDKIAVCISGGKDSMLLAKLFQELERHGKHNFELVFLVMDPGYNELNYARIIANAKLMNIPVTVFHTNIFDSVDHIANNPCYLCARMRRGHLYAKAKELGCNKIALGHHYDDVIETTLMGMLYGSQMQTMMPKLHSANFEGMELIRPMYLIREKDIIRWRDHNHLHFINCACRFTESCASCGGTEKGSKRAEVKQLIADLAKKDPCIEQNIFRSTENVNIDTLIAYKKDGVKHHFLDTYEEVKHEEV